uniref:NADH-ubiquinone oxidoreductase chain 6 n=1 Tax=Aulacochilus grouvellei TaxID=2800504 RepID=A0A7T7BXK6_9CUCU|nr:NADH dehydrogenase subunit 6 [Aulacochilus grouvellei]QQK56322.1 NADH dehydrogenase subunit 6 [Aulacochilus grouvellei]
MSILMAMLTLLSIIFLLISHPLSMGLILLMWTIFTAMLTGLMNTNYWYSYILFLVMVGGMLVLFTYMTSIASNEKFKFSPKIFLLILMIPISMFTIFLVDTFMLDSMIFNLDSLQSSSNLLQEINLMKYMNYPNNLLLIMLIFYLLLTLVIVVKMVGLKTAPLRQKF